MGALIGTEIQVDKINFQSLGYSILVLIGALVIRMIGTYFAVSCGTLNMKEKIFMSFAWLPKATVQAALGPIFLDNVLKMTTDQWKAISPDICSDEGWLEGTDMSECLNPVEVYMETKEQYLTWGNDILTLAVLSILITAPLGAVSILGLGPRLLESDTVPKEGEDNPE